MILNTGGRTDTVQWLLGHVLDTDIIKPAVQTSFIDNQMSLF